MYQYSKPLAAPMERLRRRPWELTVKPFQISSSTWYVSGQKWVSAYLIDTGDGLLLIDCGVPESLYLLIDSIYQLGFHPTDIRKLLISHAHFDHCGAAAALRELSGAEIWMSRQDAEFMRCFPEEVWFPGEGCLVQEFTPDRFYDGAGTICQGSITVKPLLTPGHTPGCTSFFWTESSGSGVRILGMHGGVGPNTMTDSYYAKSRGMTARLRRQYIAQMETLKQMHVDITLPSHPNQLEIMDRAGRYARDPDVYLDSTVWPQFIARHQKQAIALERGEQI